MRIGESRAARLPPAAARPRLPPEQAGGVGRRSEVDGGWMPAWTQTIQPASYLGAGLRLPRLGDEKDVLRYLEERYFPAFFTFVCDADEIVALRRLEHLRDEGHQSLILGDFGAAGELVEAMAQQQCTSWLARGTRMVAFELLLRVRWRRARNPLARAREPGRLSTLELLEHRLVGRLVRPLSCLPAAAAQTTNEEL